SKRLAALLLLSVAFLPAATREEVVARLLSLRNATDYTASGRLVRVAASGERTSISIAFRAHAFADGLRIFCDVTAPPPTRARILLFVPLQGPTNIRIGHPGDPSPKELPRERWGESLLGTDFTYEDLLENYVLWRRQTLLPEAQYGARTCFVLRSEPGPGDHSQYTSVTSWLDREIYHAVKVEKVVKNSGEVRTFIYYGLRQVKGVWSASQIECKVAGKPGSSLLIINRGAERPHLDRAVFNPALLTKP
ncbi:MAG: outer membrane lipoprotein-sorting protein, partial [Candidatus Solibacter sp.]